MGKTAPLSLLAGVFLLFSSHLNADLTGRVVSIADGDTLTILDASNQQTKIRLNQIDAPEKKQDFGQRSKQSLSDLVYGKPVRVEIATMDRYGRTVGKVWIGGTDANLEQVKRGMAWVYRQYAQDPAYFAAEAQARQKRIGLWDQPNPIPPWEYRHGKPATGSGWLGKHNGWMKPLSGTTAAGRCGEKRFCKEMTGCSEARYFLNECGVKGLDGDGDGRPCESLCR